MDLANSPDNDTQIAKYLHSIGINDLHQLWTGTPEESLQSLAVLQKHQLATYPFENLSLHYSPTHSISLDLDVLYQKFIEKGRGGYCMENNAFFGTVLRSLGYDVTSVGARVCMGVNGGNAAKYGSWSHMVNIVNILGKKYMVDVGFGSNGATAPLQLVENEVQERIGPGEMRLIRSKIAEQTDPNQRLWIYQIRHTPDSEWEPTYCFTGTEFLPQDYELMNFWTSQNRRSFFTYSIMMAKMIMEDGRLVGAVTMKDAEAKKRIGKEVVETRVCKSEQERLQVMREWFGIRLTQEEERAIRGTVAELRDTTREQTGIRDNQDSASLMGSSAYGDHDAPRNEGFEGDTHFVAGVHVNAEFSDVNWSGSSIARASS
ncbi:MAG: hypothetical protein LQ338_002081 [Usnochroma carphineum]|nr:MAG: hypothetical protein LQ338_002081 [Usnochroma carphineum]